jgi:hypothetical protein
MIPYLKRRFDIRRKNPAKSFLFLKNRESKQTKGRVAAPLVLAIITEY